MADSSLLRTKTREALEKGIRLGVPPFAVGASLGLLAKTVSNWMACGVRCMDEIPEKPERPDDQVELPGPRYVTAGEWYKHELECLKLALLTTRVEGLLVGRLAKRMWATSKKNPDMMKFLFKHYTHIHGIVEPKAGASVEIKSGDVSVEEGKGTSGGITVYLPHNGREELEQILKPSEKKKTPSKPTPKTKARK